MTISGDSDYPLLDIAMMLQDRELYDILNEAGATEQIMDNYPEEEFILSDEVCECL
ncbi:hypothetical protein [Dysgonomonas sp. ZJ279]|uniref:hypothetical protein n=1 Tax=Dysgonomonas sp. ZJ279 TaxID=2709796 RepID=UPI0013EAD8CA|nr:hypothetical protein [Dysgonomonas sp. ZJ279]